VNNASREATIHCSLFTIHCFKVTSFCRSNPKVIDLSDHQNTVVKNTTNVLLPDVGNSYTFVK